MKIINELGAAENRQAPAAEGTEALKLKFDDTTSTSARATSTEYFNVINYGAPLITRNFAQFS